MTKLEEEASLFAVEKHGDQTYGKGKQPYRIHLHDTTCVLRRFSHTSDKQLAVGWLHDVLEDTDATFEDVQMRFGPEVAMAVAFVTDDPGESRRVKKRMTYTRAQANIRQAVRIAGSTNLQYVVGRPQVLVLGIRAKVADRIANISACIEQGHGLLKRYVKEEGLAFHLAYYCEGVCEEMWDAYEVLIEEGRKLL